MADLSGEKCEACTQSTPPLSKTDVVALQALLNADWTVGDATLRREFRFANFGEAFTKATAIALLAEEQGHHPDLEVGWGRLAVALTTHKIHGLSRNDFVMASKIDAL